MDGGAPLDPFRVHATPPLLATFLLPAREVLPQFPVSLLGRVDPGIQGPCADAHARIVGELDWEPAGYLFRHPSPPQLGVDPVNELVVRHSVRLVRPCRPRVGMMLRLTGEVDTVMRAASVQLVAQVRAYVCVVPFWLPGTTTDFSADRGAMDSQSAGDLSW